MKKMHSSAILSLSIIVVIILTFQIEFGEIAIVEKKSSGIVLTFDDHRIENWYSAKELFEKYDARATFFVDKFYKLGEKELAMLHELNSDGHEIASHGFNHINAREFIESHGVAEYLREEIETSINIMKNNGFMPTSFAYPYGARTKETDEALLGKFGIIRGTKYTNNEKRVKDLDSVYYTKDQNNGLVFGVGIDGIYNNTTEEILDGLARAKDRGEILILYSHSIGNNEAMDDYVTSRGKLETILNYINENNMTFYTITEIAN